MSIASFLIVHVVGSFLCFENVATR